MMRLPVLLSTLLGACCLLAMVAVEARTLRCDGRLVSVGDRRYDALVACGEPDLRVPVRLQVIGALPAYPYEEVWYYNFGPHRLMRELRLREGRIIAIETAGYGFRPEHPGSCRPRDLRHDMTALELLARCGDPDDIESRTRYLGHRYGHPQSYGSVVVEEDWIYDFGPRYLYRVVTLTAGRISNVESGRRGH
jgi:hypothetical protein